MAIPHFSLSFPISKVAVGMAIDHAGDSAVCPTDFAVNIIDKSPIKAKIIAI
ncbi:hypothetical protein KAH81_03395 [bacterium]|nr:hypothetical protein [bacterium]